MKISEALANKKIPNVMSPFGKDIKTKEEFEAVKPAIKKLLAEEEYGFIPPLLSACVQIPQSRCSLDIPV